MCVCWSIIGTPQVVFRVVPGPVEAELGGSGKNEQSPLAFTMVEMAMGGRPRSLTVAI